MHTYIITNNACRKTAFSMVGTDTPLHERTLPLADQIVPKTGLRPPTTTRVISYGVVIILALHSLSSTAFTSNSVFITIAVFTVTGDRSEVEN